MIGTFTHRYLTPWLRLTNPGSTELQIVISSAIATDVVPAVL
jgi:hypothetical protein